jgi:hypothetical protein
LLDVHAGAGTRPPGACDTNARRVVMKRPIDETMAEARQFFLERKAVAIDTEARLVSEHLREMAEAIQENTRMLKVLRDEIAELHHLVGVH